jgi:hypothetical protein
MVKLRFRAFKVQAIAVRYIVYLLFAELPCNSNGIKVASLKDALLAAIIDNAK